MESPPRRRRQGRHAQVQEAAATAGQAHAGAACRPTWLERRRVQGPGVGRARARAGTSGAGKARGGVVPRPRSVTHDDGDDDLQPGVAGTVHRPVRVCAVPTAEVRGPPRARALTGHRGRAPRVPAPPAYGGRSLRVPQAMEFLPADMSALLAHKLTLGTFVAIKSNPDPSLLPSFAPFFRPRNMKWTNSFS